MSNGRRYSGYIYLKTDKDGNLVRDKNGRTIIDKKAAKRRRDNPPKIYWSKIKDYFYNIREAEEFYDLDHGTIINDEEK